MAVTEELEQVAHERTDSDPDEIRAVVHDYYEGWFDADPTRMARALHAELAKRSLWRDSTRREILRTTTAARMVELTAAGEGAEEAADRRVEIRVDEIHGAIASVTARAGAYVDYLHLCRTREGWKIVNALWAWRD